MNNRVGFAKRLGVWFGRHPVVSDALRWVVPALLFGGLLRILLISYLPYALWDADSRSFFSFTHKLLVSGSISMGEKRRYLYPLLMLPVAYLPGGALRWLPVFQHTFGWMTLVPFAYAIRKSLSCWRVSIVPLTVIYAGLPIVLWCEHELIADNLFFALFLWSFAGWVAWVTQSDPARSRRMFWVFFVPFTLFILTKPSGRFVLPGLLIGLVVVKALRRLGWQQFGALLILLAISPTVGSKRQGAWLFYQATFPLTRLDTPLHADYKAEISESVEWHRRSLDVYHAFQNKEPFYFLRDPGDQDARPLWKELGNNEKLKDKIYMDLALEGVKARPDLFLYLGLQRVVFDANVSAYGLSHFADGGFVERSAMYYAEAEKDEKSPLRLAFSLPSRGPIPPYDSFQHQLEPAPGSLAARTVQACVATYGTKLDYFRYANVSKWENKLSLVRPTFLGCWMVVALFLSFLPRYRNTLGVWAVTSLIYVFGVYLVSLVNVHYIGPVWPVLFVIMALPVDALLARFFPSSPPSTNSRE